MKLAAPGSSRCQKEKTDQNPRKYIHSVQIHLLALSSGGTGRLRNTCPFHYAFFYHKHEPQVTAEDRTQSQMDWISNSVIHSCFLTSYCQHCSYSSEPNKEYYRPTSHIPFLSRINKCSLSLSFTPGSTQSTNEKCKPSPYLLSQYYFKTFVLGPILHS